MNPKTVVLSRSNLVECLSKILGAVDKKNIHAVLSYCLFMIDNDYLKLYATDLEVQLEIEKLKTLQADKNISFTVPAKKLYDFCRVLPDEAEVQFLLHEKKDRIAIKSAGSKLELSSIDTEHFPKFEHHQFIESFTTTNKDFRSSIESVSFAMAHSDIRHYLNGMLFSIEANDLVLVATDGHRLATSQTELLNRDGSDKKISFIVPRRAIQELIKIIDYSDNELRFDVYTNSLIVKIQEMTLHCKLIEGKYPDYKRVIPKDLPYHIEVDKDELKTIMLQVMPIISTKDKGAQLLFRSTALDLKASNNDNEQISASIHAEGVCEDVEIGINLSYLYEFIAASRSKKIKIRFKDENVGILISHAHPGFYLVMPLKF